LPVRAFNRQVRHDVVHFIYMHYLLVLDRHEMCPVLMKEIGQKGPVKLCRVPPAKGYHQQSGLKCTGLRTIMRKAGLPWDVW
jgi:hypothetical protein